MEFWSPARFLIWQLVFPYRSITKLPPQEERDAGDGQKCLWCPIGIPPFYTYRRSCALLRATSAFAMLQTFGIPPRGSCSAPLHGGDGLRSSTFLIVWRSENICKCSCEHGICSSFPRCFLHIRQEAAVLDISVSAAVFYTFNVIGTVTGVSKT